MGLNQRGRGRGRGGKGSFANKGRRGGGGMGNQGPMFRPGPPPPGMFCPPMGFPPEPPFGGPFFGGPSGFNFGPPRPGFGKFPRKNFKRKPVQKNNDAPVPEIDLTKPWVTEEIKNEEAKKQECLEVWRKSKNDEDWSKYKAQKQIVHNLYDRAKDEYINNHPEEAFLWREITTTKKYYCETCDKTFRTDDDLLLHEAEHEICGREGCEFTAHPKIIAKHKKMQHDSGLYKRIGKLYTDEDIKKWIEERKRRYPSRRVIEEKKALEQEKINRGEKIKDDESKFNKEFQNKRGNKLKRLEQKSQKTRNRRSRKKTKSQLLQCHLEEEIQISRRGVPAFQGIKNSCDSEKPGEENDKEERGRKENDLEISDDEWDTPEKAQKIKEPLINNSLRLLAACYDSDEDVTDNKKESEVAKPSDDEGSGPEEVKTILTRNPTVDENETHRNPSRKRKLCDKNETQYRDDKKSRNQNNQDGLQYRKITLLEKLLKKEIRHERNIILQCVHFIVKNDFFQKM